MEDIFDALVIELRKRYYGWEGAKQFEGTADRLKRAFVEFCWTEEAIKGAVEDCFKAAYVDSYSEMLVSGPTSVWTLCPHHLLPCHFSVYIGYVPNERILGLSKFSRIATAIGHRPIIQEMYSRELAKVVWDGLRPKGVGVFVIGEHGCMRARGIMQDVNVSTSVLMGVMLDRPEVRAEFLSVVKGGNGK